MSKQFTIMAGEGDSVPRSVGNPDRDTIIGWDPVTRSQRLKLVVPLRRFLVPDQSRRPISPRR